MRKVIYKILSLNDLPYDVEIVAENLIIPWALAVSEDDRIYFTERSGNIRMIEKGELYPEPLITLQAPFTSLGEGGLMGIALDPDYQNNHYMYVMHTYNENSRSYNRVIRLIEENNKLTIDKVLIDRIPASRSHNGGRIKIGPDGFLYITTGDAGNAMLAQDLSSNAGKILRIGLDGQTPEDNPFENSPVYSYGHRNSQGLTWNNNGIMYASEHGQTAYDEINIIEPGVNYGWPIVQGDESTEDIPTRRPMLHSGRNTWAPSGIAYIDRGPWMGKLLVATLQGEQLLAITLDDEGTRVVQVQSLFTDDFGRLREVVQAEDGSIYLATSNRDGRGVARRNDDKIIRLIPR